ncbi:hypothetical protein BBP40_012718 [Aspergillus hancockii]|nr:hypothetical protein BBP40_012718 [Aspergillus hancockii]
MAQGWEEQLRLAAAEERRTSPHLRGNYVLPSFVIAKLQDGFLLTSKVLQTQRKPRPKLSIDYSSFQVAIVGLHPSSIPSQKYTMAMYNNIVLVGASGDIGKIILEDLIYSSSFNITVLSRNGSEATFPTGVKVRKTDFTDTDLDATLNGQDAVISALGATAFGEQKKLVDVLSVLKLLPLFGQKKELIEYLKTKECEGLSWTGIATGGWFDRGLRNGFLGFEIANRTATIWDGGDKSLTFTNEKLLGEAVVSVLQHPRQTSNKYIYIASVETTQNEIMASLEEETGAKWTVKATTTEEQVGESVKKLGAGDISGAFALARATSFGSIPGLRANYAKDETLVNDVLNLKLETVKGTAKRVVAE